MQQTANAHMQQTGCIGVQKCCDLPSLMPGALSAMKEKNAVGHCNVIQEAFVLRSRLSSLSPVKQRRPQMCCRQCAPTSGSMAAAAPAATTTASYGPCCCSSSARECTCCSLKQASDPLPSCDSSSSQLCHRCLQESIRGNLGH